MYVVKPNTIYDVYGNSLITIPEVKVYGGDPADVKEPKTEFTTFTDNQGKMDN